MNYLTPEQVLFIHHRIIEETGGSHGIRDISLLQSAVARPESSFDGKDLYTDLVTKAASLMHSIIKNHPFVDGNKRTAITSASIFLLRNGFRVNASNRELERFTLNVASKDVELNEITGWFKEHTKKVQT